MVTKAQFEYICRALLPEPLASEVIAGSDYNDDEGWLVYQVGDPFSLAYAAVDPVTERRLLSINPELEPQIRALQKDFDGELARLRDTYFKL